MSQDEGMVQEEWDGLWASNRLVSHVLTFHFLFFIPCLPDSDMNLKPYSLVRPVVVKTPRPVVLSPNCIAPRLIRNLLDLPTSRLDFHVCPAGRQQ